MERFTGSRDRSRRLRRQEAMRGEDFHFDLENSDASQDLRSF